MDLVKKQVLVVLKPLEYIPFGKRAPRIIRCEMVSPFFKCIQYVTNLNSRKEKELFLELANILKKKEKESVIRLVEITKKYHYEVEIIQ